MFDFDDITNENNAKHNLKWQYIPDHPYRLLIIGGFGSGKRYALLNFIKEQDRNNLIDNIYIYAKNLNEPKYQLLIKKREDLGIKHLNDLKVFIEYSQYMDDVYNIIADYNPSRICTNRKIEYISY